MSMVSSLIGVVGKEVASGMLPGTAVTGVHAEITVDIKTALTKLCRTMLDILPIGL
jgi:hypothetical protein